MSTDSPQIDITPYKVRRENVITSQQQKAWEPSPNEDLASSIMSKLTEIRGNLYPTHLNIPPHKSGAPQSATPYGYSYLSTSPAPQESGTLSSGVDALLKRDIPDYSAELLKSRDQSPSSISRDSPIFESSYSNPTNQPFFYSTTYKNTELPDKNTENTSIPKIELNFTSTQSHNLLGHSSKPYVDVPITKDDKTQFLTESSPQTNSPDYSPKQVDKNLFHMSNGYEPHKNSLLSTHAHSHLNFSESTRTGINNTASAQEKTMSQNGLYIPISRNNNVSPSPDSAVTHTDSKSNPTSTRATQTKVHISATARLPSAGKPASRTQLINSLNEALGLNYIRGDTTVDSKALNESSQHKRLEKSMEAPKRAGVNKGEKIPKQKNKSTVMLANIIGQNQDVESQRFSFGHVSSDATDSARQSGRSSNYSQRDREIQAYIDTVSKNQNLRAETLEALKKRQQNPASSVSVENYHIKSQSVSGKMKAPTDNNKILVVEGESNAREYQSKPQYIKQGSLRQTEGVTNYNQSKKDNKKSSPKESYTRQSSSQSQTQNKKKSSLNQNFNEAQASDQSQRDMRDNLHEEQDSQSVIHNEDSSPHDSERGTDIEDNVGKLNIGKGSQREKIVHQSTARTQAETMRNHEKSNRDATPSQVYSEIIKSKPTTNNQLEDDLSQVSFLKEAVRTRSRLTTKSQFDNLPYDDSTSQIPGHHDNRPLTRSQLDDETRDSGQGGFHRGSGSGSSSPNRSTSTDIIVAKKLDYQQNKNESPIRLREVSPHSRGGSVIEKSYYSESQERSVEKNKSVIVAESPKSSKKRVSEDSIRPVAKVINENQESRKESSEEREIIVSQTNLEAQTVNNPAPQQVFVPANNQRNQMPQQAVNFSPERQNLGGFMSPQSKQFNLGNNTAQMPIGYNMPMSPNLNFQMQSPIVDNDTQQQILMITNYYQSQISSLKGMIAQQNEVINQERHKNQMFERKNMELTRTIQNLEQQIRDQSHNLDSTQKDLKTRYEIVLEELASLKRTMLTYQVTAPQQESQVAPRQYPTEGKEYQTLLYHEILSLRKDLENQRSTMYDFRSSTRHLEDQMKDLEKMYIDELRSNSKINNKRESLQENFESFKNNYLKMDTLNQILVDGYERTRKDLSAMKDGQNQEMAQELDSIQTSRQARGRNIYIGSPSPTKYEVEANNQEMLRNKMRAEDSQMKNILQWNSKNEGTSIHFITNNNFTPRGKRSQATSDYNQQVFLQNNQSPNGYALNRAYSPQPNQSIMKRAAITDRKANRSQVAFPTYQKVEDPRDQVRRLDQTIAELGQHKKFVENELFKMPSVPKTLDQKRKKAGLELELEGVENQIEECKNQLRKY